MTPGTPPRPQTASAFATLRSPPPPEQPLPRLAPAIREVGWENKAPKTRVSSGILTTSQHLAFLFHTFFLVIILILILIHFLIPILIIIIIIIIITIKTKKRPRLLASRQESHQPVLADDGRLKDTSTCSEKRPSRSSHMHRTCPALLEVVMPRSWRVGIFPARTSPCLGRPLSFSEVLQVDLTWKEWLQRLRGVIACPCLTSAQVNTLSMTMG